MINKNVGVGLRPPHIEHFLHNHNEVSWLEVHSENYFSPHSYLRSCLRAIAEHYAISCHGVGLSLGSVGQLNPSHLSQLKSLIDEIQPIHVSDHLSWSQHNGSYFNDLLPLPYTEEALNVFVNNVLTVQDYLGRTMLIENPSSYLKFEHSTINEWEFLLEVQKRTECEILLDINNIYVSSLNHGFDCKTYLDAFDDSIVSEIHLAGFITKQTTHSTIAIDTHSQPVSPEVWALLQYWLNTNHSVSTLIEWDTDVPTPEVLLAEAHKASLILDDVQTTHFNRKAG
jgi:uncharacterized protein (UPF0276 family)